MLKGILREVSPPLTPQPLPPSCPGRWEVGKSAGDPSPRSQGGPGAQTHGVRTEPLLWVGPNLFLTPQQHCPLHPPRLQAASLLPCVTQAVWQAPSAGHWLFHPRGPGAVESGQRLRLRPSARALPTSLPARAGHRAQHRGSRGPCPVRPWLGFRCGESAHLAVSQCSQAPLAPQDPPYQVHLGVPVPR